MPVESIDAQPVTSEKITINLPDLKTFLPQYLHRAMEVVSEPGACSWLSTIPIHQEHGFALHNGDFVMPFVCAMVGNHLYSHLAAYVFGGHSFTVDHAMNCPCGGSLLTEVAMQWEQNHACNP